jgi:hypothetical protein
MNKNIKITAFVAAILLVLSISLGSLSFQSIAVDNADIYKQVNPIELISSPANYLNQKIKINATFDKFSTLGLDYKPAMRETKNYISFLIRRPDVTENNIPLSELKLIIKRDKAEKLIDLESGDKIEFTGNVFSDALNDPWVDVENIKVLSSKTKTVSDKKELNQTK